MKRLTFLFFFLLLHGFVSQAQVKSTLTVFSKEGEKFWVIKNGVKQNAEPQTSVSLSGISENNFKIKVLIDDESLSSVDQAIYREDVDGNVCNITCELKKNRKGKYTLGVVEWVPVSAGSSEETEPVQKPVPTPNNPVQNPVNQPVKNAEGLGMNINLQMNPEGVSMNTSTTVTTTTTTVSHGTMISEGGEIQRPPVNAGGKRPPQTKPQDKVKPNQPTSQSCDAPMSPADFSEGKALVSKTSFSSEKMNVAKQFTQAGCMTVAQIKEIMALFSFEGDKLEYVKYAYDYCFDPRKYYLVNEGFNFSSSKDDLNAFLNSRK